MCSALPFTLRHLPHAFGEYLPLAVIPLPIRLMDNNS
jgi:hypothetical protein